MNSRYVRGGGIVVTILIVILILSTIFTGGVGPSVAAQTGCAEVMPDDIPENQPRYFTLYQGTENDTLREVMQKEVIRVDYDVADGEMEIPFFTARFEEGTEGFSWHRHRFLYNAMALLHK